MSPPERARLAFAVYAQLGASRSLEQLRRVLYDYGVEVGIATLKRWSTRFQWQEQLARIDESAELQLHSTTVRARVDMLERQGGLGRALQGVGGTALQSLMNSPGRVGDLSAREIVSLIDTGTRIEATTSSEARNRKDIATQMANQLLVALIHLFDDLNTATDPEERRQRFAAGLDDIIANFVTSQEE